MTAIVYQLRDYHLKKLEREAKAILGEVLPLVEFAKTGGPIIDPWAGKHYPGGFDELPVA